jgi:hypothetical protein
VVYGPQQLITIKMVKLTIEVSVKPVFTAMMMLYQNGIERDIKNYPSVINVVTPVNIQNSLMFII